MSDALSFHQVGKSYGPVKVFEALNYRVPRGEIVAFLGANGAGKSTFISLAAGLLKPDNGEVHALGLRAGDFALKKRLRCLPQDLAFPEQLTSREIINLIRAHFKADWPKAHLESLELELLLDRQTFALSGGERRRLALVTALIGDPDLILLDEPTSSLDLIGQSAVHTVLVEHLRRTGATLIFSSHRMSEVEKLAGRMTVINRGRILADGPTADIRREFGMSKVQFICDRPIQQLQSARALTHSDRRYEALGTDADAILRELIHGHSDAHGFSVQHAPLEEIILHLWSKEAPP